MTRKQIIFLLTCCLGAYGSIAQTRFAFRAGVNMTTARIKYAGVTKDHAFTAGPHLGLQLDTEFEGPLHFSPFIAFNQRGYIIRQVNDSISEIRNNIRYIDLAPLVSYHFSNNHTGISFYLTGGPVMGFAIGGSEKRTIRGLTQTGNMTFSLTGDYGYFDLSMLGGAGLRMNRWYVEANYLFGLGNINNEVRQDKRNIQNRSIGLHVGYYFRHARKS